MTGPIVVVGGTETPAPETPTPHPPSETSPAITMEATAAAIEVGVAMGEQIGAAVVIANQAATDATEAEDQARTMEARAMTAEAECERLRVELETLRTPPEPLEVPAVETVEIDTVTAEPSAQVAPLAKRGPMMRLFLGSHPGT